MLTAALMENLSKEDLVTLVLQNKQKEILPASAQPKQKKPQKAFDFSKHKRVKIALRFSYLGKNYKGLVVQKGTEDTVEHHIFQALKKTCLIPQDESCGGVGKAT